MHNRRSNLNANGGDANKSTTATYDSSTLTSWTAPTKSGYTLTGYWTATSGGNKIINANGTLVASTSYTNGSSQWTYDGTETLYAQWEENAGGGDNASWKNNVMTPACF